MFYPLVMACGALFGTLAVAPASAPARDAARSYGCITELPHPFEESPPIYCVVRCESWDEGYLHPVWPEPVEYWRVPSGWCADQAQAFCMGLDDEVAESCWALERPW